MTDILIDEPKLASWRRSLLNLFLILILTPCLLQDFLPLDALIRTGRINIFPWIQLDPFFLFPA